MDPLLARVLAALHPIIFIVPIRTAKANIQCKGKGEKKLRKDGSTTRVTASSSSSRSLIKIALYLFPINLLWCGVELIKLLSKNQYGRKVCKLIESVRDSPNGGLFECAVFVERVVVLLYLLYIRIYFIREGIKSFFLTIYSNPAPARTTCR